MSPLRPLLPALMAMACLLVGAPLRAAPSPAALEAALEAFAAGLILGRSKRTHAIQAAVKPLVALFATIFFVLIGTGMDLLVLNPMQPDNREGLIVAAFGADLAARRRIRTGTTPTPR